MLLESPRGAHVDVDDALAKGGGETLDLVDDRGGRITRVAMGTWA
jgi:hypothetical protein